VKRFALVLSTATVFMAVTCCAQGNYPEKTVRLIVGFPAGSTADAAARLVGEKLRESLGKPVIVENVVGVGGNLAMDRAAKAPPDGYTLALAGNGQLTINPYLYKVSFEPVRDFVAVSQIYSSASLLVVNPSVPAQTLQQLLRLARSRPGELTYASGGIGSAPHIAAELLKNMAGIQMHHVPYKGIVAAIPDLIAGRIAMTIGPISQVLPALQDGRIRVLAVSSLKRWPRLPDVPTIDEAGVPGYDATIWAGLVAPAATPAAIIEKVYTESAKALASRDMREKLADLGMEAIGNRPQEFAGLIRSELGKWGKVIASSTIKVE